MALNWLGLAIPAAEEEGKQQSRPSRNIWPYLGEGDSILLLPLASPSAAPSSSGRMSLWLDAVGLGGGASNGGEKG